MHTAVLALLQLLQLGYLFTLVRDSDAIRRALSTRYDSYWPAALLLLGGRQGNTLGSGIWRLEWREEAMANKGKGGLSGRDWACALRWRMCVCVCCVCAVLVLVLVLELVLV